MKAVSHVPQSNVHASLKAFHVGICYQHEYEYIFVTFVIFVSLIILHGSPIVSLHYDFTYTHVAFKDRAHLSTSFSIFDKFSCFIV